MVKLIRIQSLLNVCMDCWNVLGWSQKIGCVQPTFTDIHIGKDVWMFGQMV